ncbi:MAG TPA: Gfo/Idh/MocA family oxidoreductase [Xanthobacteraceae bacterium]|nr:Gfo/Idh/MocA family oxidoreductase [Xanthobacteraceae bacterium]
MRDSAVADHAPRVVVIGCGYWGKNLVRNFYRLNSLAGICDPDRDAVQNLTREYQSKVYAWNEVLRDPEVQAVAIAAPAALHAQLASAALEAGKHVFVEKPLALRVAEAQSLCELADRKNLRLMVGHLLQYHPAFLKLAEIVSGGALGRLQYIYSTRLNLGRIRREEDILWSFAPHDISMILSLVGEEPERVHAEGGNFLHKSIADVTTTHLAFPSGVLAHIFVSWLHPFKEQKLVVVGDRGMAVFNDGENWDRKLQIYPHQIEWRDGLPLPRKVEAQPIPLAASEPLQVECAHFIAAVRNGTAPRTDGREGVRVLKILEAASNCLRETQSRRPVTISGQQPMPGIFVHATACIDAPVEIGEGTKIWHFSHVLPRTKIGRNCILGQNVMIGPDVTVGNNCKFQNNVSVYPGVTIEDGVFCGPSCVFTNVMNPRAEIERKSEFRKTLVKRGATIGANATIICGTTLGEYCFIGAGAVVTRDVPDYALMVGAPARRVGWMSRAGAKLGPDLKCPIDGSQYIHKGPDRLEMLTEDHAGGDNG